MYQILGVRNALYAYALASALLVAACFGLQKPDGVVEGWRIISSSLLFVGVAVWVLGQSPLFPLICRLPLISRFLPDISGHWEAEISTNWPEIQKLMGQKPDQITPIHARVEVIARLFYVSMTLMADNRYSNSETVLVGVRRNSENGRVRLYYVYKNDTPNPKATDSSQHFGAAYLDVHRSPEGVHLEGHYWTDRNWHKGHNTAGVLTFKRSAKS